MPEPGSLRRVQQLTATFHVLGVDNVTMTWDYTAKRYRINVGWHDLTDRPPINIQMTGMDQIGLYVAAGMKLSERLASERPELTFPEVVWT